MATSEARNHAPRECRRAIVPSLYVEANRAAPSQLRRGEMLLGSADQQSATLAAAMMLGINSRSEIYDQDSLRASRPARWRVHGAAELHMASRGRGLNIAHPAALRNRRRGAAVDQWRGGL